MEENLPSHEDQAGHQHTDKQHRVEAIKPQTHEARPGKPFVQTLAISVGNYKAAQNVEEIDSEI